MIYSAASGIETSLEIVDDFIYEALYNVSMQSPSELYTALRYETDPVRKAQARSQMLKSLTGVATWSNMVDFVLLYTEREDGESWLGAGNADSYISRLEVKQKIEQEIKENKALNHGRYLVYRGKAKNYILRILRLDGSFLFIGVSNSEIQKALQEGAGTMHSIAFAVDAEGKLIFSSDEIRLTKRSKTDTSETVLDQQNEGRYIRVNDTEYLQSGHVSQRSGLYFGVLTRGDTILKDMWVFRATFVILFLAMIVFVPISFYMITHFVTKPIERVSLTLKQISEEEPVLIKKEKTGLMELSHFIDAFNEMIERVRRLRIEKYEVKLAEQKATMNYLQLQIKPHFYANVLNIIYSLAEKKDFEKIQKISSSFVSYARYMFQDAGELVELGRELAHVTDFMEIQKIRYVNQMQCHLDVPKELLGALIPPFIIQSFVENSTKYAFTSKNHCNIMVHIRTDESGENLMIMIRDSGKGYDEATLQLDWENKNEEGHIGLTNVYRRLKLIYEEKAAIEIWNDFGAVTRITLPYIAVDNMDLE